jgi:hypothetical protein
MRGEPLRWYWKAITFLNTAIDTETLVLVTPVALDGYGLNIVEKPQL